MFHDAFGAKLAGAPTRWIEPPWKAVLSNKGILPLLWEMFPNHPNLLPAFFEDDPRAAELGSSYVRKPLLSREGANVTLVSGGMSLDEHAGPYGAEGFVRQALSPLPNFSGFYPVVGSWLVNHEPCGLRSARTRARSRATARGFCRMRFCEAFSISLGRGSRAA